MIKRGFIRWNPLFLLSFLISLLCLAVPALVSQAAEQWRTTSIGITPVARAFHTALWTGTQMVAWGGINDSGRLNTGGCYTP